MALSLPILDVTMWTISLYQDICQVVCEHQILSKRDTIMQ